MHDPDHVARTLKFDGSAHSGEVAREYAEHVAYLAARAVENGMKEQDFYGYFKGLSDMAGACVRERTMKYTNEVLRQDDAAKHQARAESRKN